MKLVLWGAGGHGKVVLDVARASGRFKEIVFVDDALLGGEEGFCDCRLMGSSARLECLREAGYMNFLVSIGRNDWRERCFGKALTLNLAPATLVHPSAVISPSARLGAGTVVMARVVVNSDTEIGHNCILNTGAVVEHDCRIGDHVHLAPAVTLGGGVTVGRCSLVGIGSIALPGARIGEGAVVGAGAVVLDSVPSGTTVVGVPAKVLSQTRT